jgi:hypothetical protein
MLEFLVDFRENGLFVRGKRFNRLNRLLSKRPNNHHPRNHPRYRLNNPLICHMAISNMLIVRMLLLLVTFMLKWPIPKLKIFKLVKILMLRKLPSLNPMM